MKTWLKQQWVVLLRRYRVFRITSSQVPKWFPLPMMGENHRLKGVVVRIPWTKVTIHLNRENVPL